MPCFILYNINTMKWLAPLQLKAKAENPFDKSEVTILHLDPWVGYTLEVSLLS